MPICIISEDDPAKATLETLRVVVTIQNELFEPVRRAAALVRGLGTEQDREEYERICKQIQALQCARLNFRAEALREGASSKSVRKCERYAERSYIGHY